jgi:sortase B
MNHLMKKILLITVVVTLSSVILFSGFKVWRYFEDQNQNKEQFDGLADLIQTQTPTLEDDIPEQSEEPQPEWTVYDQYRALFEQNDDMVGWISIDGTTINYPVMQTPDRPDFYLKHDFEKKYSDYGVPYASEACDLLLPSDNITIYGHHMKGGQMFGALETYKKETFYRQYPIVCFDTRAGFGRYEIVAVFRTTPDRFPYNRFINAENETAFQEYVSRCKALAFYDTGVTATYGDKLITLSTCEYSEKNSRLVVIAKRIME